MNNVLKGIIYTLVGGILWGFSGVCGQYLFQYKNINPQCLSVWRLFVTGIIILAILAPKYKMDVFKVFSRETIIPVLVYCFVSCMGCQYAYFMAIYYSNSATATVLQYIAPAVVMIVTCASNRKFPTIMQFMALICAMVGVFYMATGGSIGSLSISGLAVIWGLLGGVCYASNTLQGTVLSKKCGVLLLLGWGNLIGSLPIMVINSNILFDFTLDIPTILAFLGTTIIGSLLSFAIFIKGCQLAGSITGSLCACIEPVSSAVITYFWLGTRFQFSDIVGLVLIILTVVIISLDKIKNKDNIVVSD